MKKTQNETNKALEEPISSNCSHTLLACSRAFSRWYGRKRNLLPKLGYLKKKKRLFQAFWRNSETISGILRGKKDNLGFLNHFI